MIHILPDLFENILFAVRDLETIKEPIFQFGMHFKVAFNIVEIIKLILQLFADCFLLIAR